MIVSQVSLSIKKIVLILMLKESTMQRIGPDVLILKFTGLHIFSTWYINPGKPFEKKTMLVKIKNLISKNNLITKKNVLSNT